MHWDVDSVEPWPDVRPEVEPADGRTGVFDAAPCPNRLASAAADVS